MELVLRSEEVEAPGSNPFDFGPAGLRTAPLPPGEGLG